MKTYKTLKQLADDCGIAEITAKRWNKAGKISKIEKGHKYYIPGT